MNETTAEELGIITDELESLVHATKLPMPSDFHLEQLKQLLPEKIKAIRDIIVKETGENPWE
ncbi:hypothetical protein V6R21_07655 [Limibacter armeniacum]|uniref:hypothetical protein n=1 Tax=Limibacter armeniacum TaxID=466084 RepID=UPI002FE5AE4C